MSKALVVQSVYPGGKQLPALERNILKYRAYEMAMILFYVEDLKNFVIDSIQSTDKILGLRGNSKPRIPSGAKNKCEMAWAVLVVDGIISEEESKEIQRLIDYRNDIAHRIHELTCDLSREPFARDYAAFRKSRYDYEAVKILRQFREKISHGIQGRYIMPLSFDELLFEYAEKTYQEELKRLDRKIMRQMEVRKEEIRRLNAELSNVNCQAEDFAPSDPRNIAANGKLTPLGVETCYRLFDRDLSTLAVAHLMGISYRSAVKRRQTWEKVGGRQRASA